MGQPAARVCDLHFCPMVTPGVPPIPHVGGPVLPPGVPTVWIGGMPAATVTSMCVCVGPPDMIVKGSPTVLIGGMPAARMGDSTAHGGIITIGCLTVLIGDVGMGSEFNIAELKAIVDAVNPLKGTDNCGNIIDAAVARLQGTDPDATAPLARDGTWGEIETRFKSTLTWGQNMDGAFKAVQDGGPGTTAVVGIKYKSGGSHVVVMTNHNGTVGILEGQDWGPGNGQEVITDTKRANTRYGSDSDIGVAILPKPVPKQP